MSSTSRATSIGLGEIRRRCQVFRASRDLRPRCDGSGNVAKRTDEGRVHDFGYDEADRLLTHLDRDGSGCGDDRQTTVAYLPTGWEKSRVVRKSNGGCDPAVWPVRQTTLLGYFKNGDLATLKTANGAVDANGNPVSPAEWKQTHTLGYEQAGVYLNGHRRSDAFTLKGPDSSASCHTSACTARYAYDARERLTEWEDGYGGTTSYTLDADTAAVDSLEGNITREAAPEAARRFTYNQAGQLQTISDDANTVLERHHWNTSSGNLLCITAPAGVKANCNPPKDADVSPHLRSDYAFDGVDRLRGYRRFNNTAKTGNATYTYDAADRLSSVEEKHPGMLQDRTSAFSYVGLSDRVSSETQTGETTAEKRYSYDADGGLVGMSSGSSDYTYGRDGNGSISLLINQTGSVSASYGYKPYGDRDETLSKGDLSTTNPLNPYRFQGFRYDSGSGSLDMGARRYGPDVGRFLQQDYYRGALADLDLSEDPLAQNRYAFAGGNPINFVEVDGHRPDPARLGVSNRDLCTRVPDKFSFQGEVYADFTHACKVHDGCYGRWTTTRKACDDRFERAVKRSCVDLNDVDFGLDAGREAVNANKCLVVARFYVAGVRKFGHAVSWMMKAYRDAPPGVEPDEATGCPLPPATSPRGEEARRQRCVHQVWNRSYPPYYTDPEKLKRDFREFVRKLLIIARRGGPFG